MEAMGKIISTIGTVITSPYPYFAVFGYLGFLSYQELLAKEPSGYLLGFFVIELGFLAYLCALVYILIQKVGHSSMLPPEFQVELEKLKSQDRKRNEVLAELKASLNEGGDHE